MLSSQVFPDIITIFFLNINILTALYFSGFTNVVSSTVTVRDFVCLQPKTRQEVVKIFAILRIWMWSLSSRDEVW